MTTNTNTTTPKSVDLMVWVVVDEDGNYTAGRTPR
jgi:hypothetical protein